MHGQVLNLLVKAVFYLIGKTAVGVIELFVLLVTLFLKLSKLIDKLSYSKEVKEKIQHITHR